MSSLIMCILSDQIKEDEVDGACSIQGEMRPGCRFGHNINMTHKIEDGGERTEFTLLRLGTSGGLS
jgi:hypothetical protein